MICYDLRFPVFARNVEEYDLLIYVANWPQVRTLAWDTLLRARAIENQAYVVGVNRVGKDGNGHSYVGHTQAIDALGEYVLEPQRTEAVFTVTLNRQATLDTRGKLAFLNDRDSFELM